MKLIQEGNEKTTTMLHTAIVSMYWPDISSALRNPIANSCPVSEVTSIDTIWIWTCLGQKYTSNILVQLLPVNRSFKHDYHKLKSNLRQSYSVFFFLAIPSINTAEKELETSFRPYPGILRLILNPLIFIINQQESRLLSETLYPSTMQTEQSLHLPACAMVF